MTGPTGHLLSSTAPLSHILRHPILVDNGWSDILAGSTIDLHDAATTWPCRALERRRAFQLLVDRYNRQILYGCQNPHCETPTCLSRRKRVTKGPFRPYTVLSARTLATFLASQDDPEKGLCPHQTTDTDRGLWLSTKEVKLVSKKSEIRRNSPASPKSGQATLKSNLASGAGSIPDYGRKIRVRIADGQTKTLGLKPEIQRAQSHEEPKGSNQNRKDKDPKSFTQNLFDTVAMNLLSRGNTLDGRLPWAPSNQRAQAARSTTLYSPSPETKTDGDVLKNTEEDAEQRPIIITETTKASQSCDLFRDDPTGGIAFDRGNNTSLDVFSSSIPVQDTAKLNGKHVDIEAPNDHWEKQLTGDNEEDESAQGATKPTPNVSEADLESYNLGEAGAMLQPKTSVLGSCQPEQAPKPVAHSLSHFTAKNVIALREMRAACRSDLHEQHLFLRSLGRTDLPQHPSKCGSYGYLLAYRGQSLTYILSNTEALLRSFLHCDDRNTTSISVSSYDFGSIVISFRELHLIDMHPCKIFPSLWISAGRLYPTPTAISKRRPSTALDLDSFPLDVLSTSPDCPLSDLEVCHIAKIMLAALVASVPRCSTRDWLAVRKLHASGRVAPSIDADNSPAETKRIGNLVRTLQAFESGPALNLVSRLAKSVDIRYQLARAEELAEKSDKRRKKRPSMFSQVIGYVNSDCVKIVKIGLANDKPQPSIKGGGRINTRKTPVTWHREQWPIIVEWLRAVILREWDGKARIKQGSAVRGALGLMSNILEIAGVLQLDWDLFHMPFLSERLDVMDEPSLWLNSGSVDDGSVHLLDFPFLFPPSALVAYFRSINHSAMYGEYRDSVATSRLCHAVTWPDDRTTGRGAMRLHNRLHSAMTEYLVLEARRDYILMDAMNEIYRRQKRELLKPLKVRMVGEEGIDHGGVQQEFFRVAIAEALNPDYGVFTTDPVTRMSWFHPSSPEPVYKFEMLGILVSLAVYNGVTLPFTFPLVMYRKLCGLHSHKLSDLEDGWPELVKGLKALRDWKDGNVEDVFMRAYVFSIDKFGATEDRLIGQYEKAERTDEDKMENFFGRSKKVAKILRIKRKPVKVFKAAVELSEEEILSHLRDGQSQNTTGGSNGPSTSDSRFPVPLSVERGDSPVLSSAHEEETFQSSNSRESEKASAEVDREMCMSDSSSPTSITAGSTAQNTPMVNNENRDQYIQDYIHQLTYQTVYEQFDAFKRGFFTCFQPKAISLFTPSTLKALVEGLPDISVSDLHDVTRYDGGYEPTHPTILQFWNVVYKWPQDRVRKLLEFVTASDRLPVGGVENLVFTVQRNGIGDERLPTSLTCFGRLLLPEYTSRERLQEALEKAVENSKGFGQP